METYSQFLYSRGFLITKAFESGPATGNDFWWVCTADESGSFRWQLLAKEPAIRKDQTVNVQGLMTLRKPSRLF